MDTETQKTFQKGNVFTELVNSEGWAEARKLLDEEIMDLQSVLNIKTSDPKVAFLEMQSRGMAVTVLFNWLKKVEAKADQHKDNSKSFEEDPVVNRY